MLRARRHGAGAAFAAAAVAGLVCTTAWADPLRAQMPAVQTAPAQQPTVAPPPAALAQTLDRFLPSPRQTIALREFLGAHVDKPVALGQQANGLFLFELRDAQNNRSGQIAVGTDSSEGSIFVARISGPGQFDMSRRAQTPRLLNAKMHDGISALLNDSLAGPPFASATAQSRDLFLRERPMLGIAADPVTAPDRIIEAEASFFADGSGYYRAIRAPVGSTSAPIHLAARYYPAMTGDGRHAFRDAVIGIDADLTASLTAFGNKPVCPIAGCGASQPVATVTLAGDLHFTRWPHAVVPSASPALIAQIMPPPQPQQDALAPVQPLPGPTEPGH